MMSITRRTALAALPAAAMSLALPWVSVAAEPASAVNVLHGNRIAIHGYDPVAYFVDGGPRKGRDDLALEHGGARWLFASEENRRRFEAEPERYLPVYGGYCAYGVAQGYKVKIDPDAWSIVNSRLYLNYDLSVRDTWLKDVSGHLKKADANWPRLSSSK